MIDVGEDDDIDDTDPDFNDYFGDENYIVHITYTFMFYFWPKIFGISRSIYWGTPHSRNIQVINFTEISWNTIMKMASKTILTFANIFFCFWNNSKQFQNDWKADSIITWFQI